MFPCEHAWIIYLFSVTNSNCWCFWTKCAATNLYKLTHFRSAPEKTTRNCAILAATFVKSLQKNNRSLSVQQRWESFVTILAQGFAVNWINLLTCIFILSAAVIWRMDELETTRSVFFSLLDFKKNNDFDWCHCVSLINRKCLTSIVSKMSVVRNPVYDC